MTKRRPCREYRIGFESVGPTVRGKARVVARSRNEAADVLAGILVGQRGPSVRELKRGRRAISNTCKRRY